MKSHYLNRYILLLLILIFNTAYGQKGFKTIRICIKENKIEEALQKIHAIENDSSQSKPSKLYYYAIEANLKKYKHLNENLYLNRKIDTTNFYNTILEIYRYACKCDSTESTLKKNKYLKNNRLLIKGLYQNLSAGGRYFFRKKNYVRTIQLMNMATLIPKTNLWGDDKTIKTKALYTNNVLILVKSLFYEKKYNEIKHYESFLLQNKNISQLKILQTLAESNAINLDSARYINILQKGIIYEPTNLYFYSKLSEYYNKHKAFKESLMLANYMLKNDSTNANILVGKSLVLMLLGKDAAAIQYAKQAIHYDPNISNAYFYAGASYYNLAQNTILPSSIRDVNYIATLNLRRSFFRKAMPFLEKYKMMRPLDKEKWAPLLYHIYLELNESKKFEEINSIL